MLKDKTSKICVIIKRKPNDSEHEQKIKKL
jgi:hypothetical protein